MLPRANRSNSVQVLAVPAAIANYVLGEIQQALGFSGNFLPALAGAILIGLALRALLNVSCCAERICTTGWHLSLCWHTVPQRYTMCLLRMLIG